MLNKFRKYFFAGLLITLPLFLSAYFIFIILRFIDGVAGNLINAYLRKEFGLSIPGLGIILLIVIMPIFGFFSTRFLGRIFVKSLDKFVNNFPLIKYIYPSVKIIFEFLFSKKHPAFKKTVLVEYPSKGAWSVGFITNDGFAESREKTGLDLVNVYIPFAPNPASGFFALLPRKEVVVLDMSIKDALQLIISGGMINPGDITK